MKKIGYGILDRARDKQSLNNENYFEKVTTGVVVDTNDPQQMGRVRVLCSALGDQENETADLPWALYMSPFGGTTDQLSRGPNGDDTSGSVAYGMWNIPKIGAQAIVVCLDGDPNSRVWLGCLYGQFSPHTMPHGRYTVQGGDLPGNNKPEGPIADDESAINPLYSNMATALGTGGSNYERRTRGADYSVAAVDEQIVAGEQVESFIPDDKDQTYDGVNYRQGYAVNRTDPNAESDVTGDVYDSQSYSWTTPGFHSIAMDDRPENGRMRFRSTTGHQLILDDTNERIYIATAKGNNWVELDQSGNIDIHSERRVSIHAAKDINFSTEGAFRVNASQGIHLNSGTDARIHAKDIHIKADDDLRAESGATLYIDSGEDINLKASDDMKITSGKEMGLNSSKEVKVTGKRIELNGPNADKADSADASESFLPNRVPQHEPWGRIMMEGTDNDSGNSQTLQLSYSSADVGKRELTDTISRGPHWRR